MKNPLLLSVVILTSVVFLSTARAADIGVSVSMSEPGFYGRIDMGRAPAPMVVYPRPLIIEQHPTAMLREPIYLRVPPGYEKHWEKNCARYHACGQPVYFVQDRWYREVYAPRYNHEVDRHNEEHGNHGNHKKRRHENNPD